MIKTEFANTTVLTIAHRIHTICQYDRIMVLGNGQILEFDTPNNLINSESSYFQSIIKEFGID
jgi:ATP-binding cassette subfamily C (CFTR/MRP) protein 4